MLAALTKRLSVWSFIVTLSLCFLLSLPAHAKYYNDVTFLDSDTGFEISKLGGAKEISLSWHKAIAVKVVPSKKTDKMRLEALDDPSKNACQFEKITGKQNVTGDGKQYYSFSFQPKESATSCSLRVVGWTNPWNWIGDNDFKVNFSSSVSDRSTTNQVAVASTPKTANVNTAQKEYRITAGTNKKSEMILGSVVARNSHGVRIYCPVSHLSYDDPVIFPNQPGRSHLHMFVGNTSTDASSNVSKLLNSGNSTCEGGINLKSSYWVPALFNGKDEWVMPEMEFIYYKTFMAGNADYSKLQIIPNGLEMLADKSTLNANDSLFKTDRTTKDGKETLLISVFFPSCFATENGAWNGKPILSYKKMPGDKASIVNSHVAYPGGKEQNDLGCPVSHPYRSPTMSLKFYYDIKNLTNGWYLSSDIDRNKPGSTLHADYIAAWDPETMKRITQCNKESRNCNFEGGRSGLPERFKSPTGEIVYRNSMALESNIDRTPYGNLLKPIIN